MQIADLDRYATPYRYGRPALEGSGISGAFDSRSVDVPFVFMHQGRYYMMYTGFDGKGYQTALAVSDDLLHWEFSHMMLSRESLQRWDASNLCGTWLLKESDALRTPARLKKYQGRYWMVYHAYPGDGYEEGPAEIGLAWCAEDDLRHWVRLENPVLSWRDGEAWEHGGLYKAGLLEIKGTFYLFYNAKTDGDLWVEQTGLCTSADMVHWTRSKLNPLLPVSPGRWDSRFASDPYVVHDGADWLMFYYGFDGNHAQDGIACSEDLLHWRKREDPLLANGAPGSLDSIHAHKPALFWQDGRLYHFYCACREHRPGDKTEVWNEYRTITVASNQSFTEEEQS